MVNMITILTSVAHIDIGEFTEHWTMRFLVTSLCIITSTVDILPMLNKDLIEITVI